MVNEIAMSHGLPLGQLSNPVVSLLWLVKWVTWLAGFVRRVKPLTVGAKKCWLASTTLGYRIWKNDGIASDVSASTSLFSPQNKSEWNWSNIPHSSDKDPGSQNIGLLDITWNILVKLGKNNNWLNITFHIILYLLYPTFILYYSAFQIHSIILSYSFIFYHIIS